MTSLVRLVETPTFFAWFLQRYMFTLAINEDRSKSWSQYQAARGWFPYYFKGHSRLIYTIEEMTAHYAKG